MVKVKNKKNFGVADKVHAKTLMKKKRKINPFEVHINREKYQVLGKRSKNDRGLPGVSRAKAIQKRKSTIGQELKLVNKNNTFLDKRIGEKNVALSEEDKVMARFAAERIHQHRVKSDKQSIYNLAEEEVLTHRGQTLKDIEKFDDPRSDDENEEEMMYSKTGKLKDDFVSDTNFGGGVLSRNESKDGALSRKDLIEQLILESKKRKIEKQKLKEETLDLTEKLDSEWKDLHSIVSKDFNKEVEKSKQKPISIIDTVLSEYEKKNEAYDKMMRELKFEPRGTPSDRLKSEDEIAKIEKERLEKLEQDRLKRMQGISGNNIDHSTKKHKSADDLDDNFTADSDDGLALVYDAKGNAVMKDDHNEDEDESDTENEGGIEDENSDDEDNENDSEAEDSFDDLKGGEDQQSSDEENDISTKHNMDANTGEKSCQNGKTTIKGNTHDVNQIGETTKTTTETSLSSKMIEQGSDDPDKVDGDKIKADLLAKKTMMEKAAAELPYTFEMPKNYDSLHDLLVKHSPNHQHIIIERMIKCNHPKLAEENKGKLCTLFAYLLQYLNDIFSDSVIQDTENVKSSFRCLDLLSCHFYDLAQMDPHNAKNCIQEVIKEKYEEYKSKPKTFPHLDTLVYFKLVSLLFPTSDVKHPVATPCFTFMSQILNTCKVRKCTDVANGLLVATLVLEYVSLSKRILPDAINFIRGVLFLAIPTDFKHKIKVLYPFKRFGPSSNLLVISENVKEDLQNKWQLTSPDLIDNTNTDRFKVGAAVTALKIFCEFFNQAEGLSAREPLYREHINLIKQIPTDKYPKSVVELFHHISHDCEEKLRKQELRPIVERKKPKTLKLYEPAFDTEFSGRKKKNLPKEKIEHEKLLHKHKKEMKGALREIRRDKAFISAVKIKEKIQSDNLRKEKVKRIYSEASMQQGELNALQRSKKKKK